MAESRPPSTVHRKSKMLQQVNDIRYKIYDHYLKKKLADAMSRRQNKPMNFQQADSIGILFDATHPTSRVFINEYRESLIAKDKRVSILGYFNDKKDHQNVIFKYFNNKDLTWHWHPKSQVVREFTDKRFDILIGLHLVPCPPLEYVAALSQAHIRVGRYRPEREHCYDLMIDIADDYDLKGFADQIEAFLKRVNEK